MENIHCKALMLRETTAEPLSVHVKSGFGWSDQMYRRSSAADFATSYEILKLTYRRFEYLI